MYLIWNPRPTGGCRLSYSEVEELGSLTKAKHTLVRAAAEKYGFQEPCTLTIISDVPKGTGLGSSSALAVCLCHLAVGMPGEGLEHGAFVLEQSVSPNVGLQDFLPASRGGFNIWSIGPLFYALKWQRLPRWIEDIVNSHGLLLYTGQSRPASEILKNWDKSEMLRKIHDLADLQKKGVLDWTPESLSCGLNDTWSLKSKIPGVCAPELSDQYERAMKVGALGGKLCGAGGGGCWFFIVPPNKREAVKEELGLGEIPFQVAEKGVEEWEL